MNRKRQLRYGLVGALLIAGALLMYVYQEYLGEDTVLTAGNPSSFIINQRLNALVLRTAAVRVSNQPKLEIACTDLGTQETASFTIDDQYRQNIHVGDTLTKEKGEKLLLVYQKSGKIATVPID